MFMRMTSSAAALLALTAPALADVTPAEVWQNWVDYYQANGYAVTEGSRDEAGGTLTIKDATFTHASGEGDGDMTVTVPELVLQETGDGKVRTTIAERSAITFRYTDEEDRPVTAEASATLKGAEIVTGGTAADMTHDGKVAEAVVALDKIVTAEGEKTFPLSLKLTGTAYQQRVVDGEIVAITSSGGVDRVELAGTVTEDGPEMAGTTTFALNLDAVQGSGQAQLPKAAPLGAAADLNAALKAGLDVAGTLTMGALDLTFDHAGKSEDGADQTIASKTGGKGIEVTFGLSPAGIKYQASGDQLTSNMTSSDLPFPISYALDSTSADIQFPVMRSDTPAPFKFAYSLGGLTLDDAIWGMFDPNGTLPRDPASLDIDITGLVRIAADLFDPATLNASDDADDAPADDAATEGTDDAAPGQLSDAPAESGATPEAEAETPAPFEPVEITINKLGVQALGARIDASGALTVPEGGSMDAPVGTITARMEGLNALIDKAVAFGLIGQDEVTGYRMMLAAFAKPAPEGGDALVSEFEFREGGQIFANGQQVQ
ncbi:DUF2125 domain-containing protein [Paracoccus luteus]|uniref:DUF2125 domain-containing protein n=1 Tax=Paracoccus luteus TaxID=2508543 RepID=UPI00106F26FC|nr:DUF2125 domain-containing protein [Paracoccus luteus]